MDRTALAVSEKLMHLTDAQLAEADQFVEALQIREHSAPVKSSMPLSESSFAAIWNNAEDACYEAL